MGGRDFIRRAHTQIPTAGGLRYGSTLNDKRGAPTHHWRGHTAAMWLRRGLYRWGSQTRSTPRGAVSSGRRCPYRHSYRCPGIGRLGAGRQGGGGKAVMATTTPLLLVWRRQWLWKRGFGFPPEVAQRRQGPPEVAQRRQGPPEVAQRRRQGPPEVAQRRRQGPLEPVQPVLPPTHPPPLPGPEAKLWFRAVAGPEGGQQRCATAACPEGGRALGRRSGDAMQLKQQRLLLLIPAGGHRRI